MVPFEQKVTQKDIHLKFNYLSTSNFVINEINFKQGRLCPIVAMLLEDEKEA